MIAAAADLHQVFGIIAVLAAIFFVAGDRATTARMSALFTVAFICHLSTFFPESSRTRTTSMGADLCASYARPRGLRASSLATLTVQAAIYEPLFTGALI
jgi:low temperature requirement protein LtrA